MRVSTAGKPGPGANTAVWLPEIRSPGAPRGAAAKVAQSNKEFSPRVSIVRAGSEVAFPNLDRIFHNVFSLSPTKSFDLGLYRNGASKSVAFDKPGLVHVFCNIHSHMIAYLLVVDSDIYGITDQAGNITLERVPAGMQTVSGWSAEGEEWSRSVVVKAAGTAELEVTLDATGHRETPHKNKYGKDYPPPDDEQDRY
ncbi:MAG: methylamine utilization protein [Candidatus Schekmanbacteria bacterium]|nr:methylamine utilization protein [Candidatus Schekmanbacteria bacterium]